MTRSEATQMAQRLSKATPIKHWNHGRSFFIALEGDSIAEDTWFLLIDKSDADNYPHPVEGNIVIHNIWIDMEVENSGAFEINFCVVIENDGTDGSAMEFYGIHRETNVPLFTDLVRCFSNGFNCEIVEGAPKYFVSNTTHANVVDLANDSDLASPIGTSNPGVGDVVALVNEISGAGDVDGMVIIEYSIM